MVAILLLFSMVLDKMAAILFTAEHHWKTKQRATIGILKAFGIPAPTVLHVCVIQIPNDIFFQTTNYYLLFQVTMPRFWLTGKRDRERLTRWGRVAAS